MRRCSHGLGLRERGSRTFGRSLFELAENSKNRPCQMAKTYVFKRMNLLEELDDDGFEVGGVTVECVA